MLKFQTDTECRDSALSRLPGSPPKSKRHFDNVVNPGALTTSKSENLDPSDKCNKQEMPFESEAQPHTLATSEQPNTGEVRSPLPSNPQENRAQSSLPADEGSTNLPTTSNNVSLTVASRLYYHYNNSPNMSAFCFLAENVEGKRRARFLTNSELYQLVVKAAYHFKTQYGIAKNDVICCMLPNSLERLVIDLGIILAGAIVLSGPTDATSQQAVDYFCDYFPHLDVKIVIYSEFDEDAFHVITRARQLNCREMIVSIPSTQLLRSQFLHSITDIEMNEAETDLPDIIDTDVAVMWPTRGFSGRVRIISHTHKNLMQFGDQLLHALRVQTPKDILFTSGGLGTVYGFPYAYLLTGYFTIVEDKILKAKPLFLNPQFTNVSFSSLQKYGCTKCYFTARDLEKYYESGNIQLPWYRSKMDVTLISGDLVKKEIVQSMLNVCKDVRTVYSMTEIGIVAFQNEHGIQNGDPTIIPEYFEKEILLLSNNVQVKVKSLPNNVDLPIGHIGALEVRNDNIQPMISDLDLNSENIFVEIEPWIHTHDLAYLHKDQNINVMGRFDAQSVYVPNGALYAFIKEETEYYLQQLYGVKEATMVNCKIRHTELVVACVALKKFSPSSIQQVTKACKKMLQQNRYLWKPDDYCFFDALPKTWGGLVNRNSIKIQIEANPQKQAWGKNL